MSCTSNAKVLTSIQVVSPSPARQNHLKRCPAPVSKLTVSTGQIDRLPPDKITSVSCTSHAKVLTPIQVVSPAPAGQKHLSLCLAPARPGLRLPFRSSHRLLPDKNTTHCVLHQPDQGSDFHSGRLTVSRRAETPAEPRPRHSQASSSQSEQGFSLSLTVQYRDQSPQPPGHFETPPLVSHPDMAAWCAAGAPSHSTIWAEPTSHL